MWNRAERLNMRWSVTAHRHDQRHDVVEIDLLSPEADVGVDDVAARIEADHIEYASERHHVGWLRNEEFQECPSREVPQEVAEENDLRR